MFNGIIKNTGIVKSIVSTNNNCAIEVLSSLKISKKEIGSSISCSGACLTIESYKKNVMKFFVSKETKNLTIFKFLRKGDVI